MPTKFNVLSTARPTYASFSLPGPPDVIGPYGREDIITYMKDGCGGQEARPPRTCRLVLQETSFSRSPEFLDKEIGPAAVTRRAFSLSKMNHQDERFEWLTLVARCRP